MSLWNSHSKKSSKPKSEPLERPTIPLPVEVYVDAALDDHIERQHMSMVDQAYEEFVAKGGLENLPGFGKPLVVPTGDPLDSILKNAKAAPPWVMLRKEIQLSIEHVLGLLDSSASDETIHAEIHSINEKIVQMNVSAPSLSLHRKKITRENIREQKEKWL